MNIWCAVTPKGSDEIGKPHFSACTSFLYATWRARHCGTFCTLQWFDPLFEGCLLLRLPSRCYLVAETGLEPVTFSLWSCLAAVATLRVRFERTTCSLRVSCSASWATKAFASLAGAFGSIPNVFNLVNSFFMFFQLFFCWLFFSRIF